MKARPCSLAPLIFVRRMGASSPVEENNVSPLIQGGFRGGEVVPNATVEQCDNEEL